METIINKSNGTVKVTIELQKETDRIIRSIDSDDLEINDLHDYYVFTLRELKLRKNATRKIESAMKEMMDSAVNYIESREFYKKGETYTVDIFNESNVDVYARDLNGDLLFIPKENLRGTSVECVSWHFHDVYQDLKGKKLILKIDDNGHRNFYLDDSELYDLNKINTLRESDGFKNKRYSFFFYDRVLKLLGEKTDSSDDMSGLF